MLQDNNCKQELNKDFLMFGITPDKYPKYVSAEEYARSIQKSRCLKPTNISYSDRTTIDKEK